MYLTYHYEYSSKSDFKAAFLCLVEKSLHYSSVVRLVFWGNPNDNNDFLNHRNYIYYLLQNMYGLKIPAFSYVAQPVLGSAVWGLEVQVLENCLGSLWEYSFYEGFSYVKILQGEINFLFLSGIFSSDLFLSIRKQAIAVMEKIVFILEKEGFEISDIVRQWNYIERITDFDSSMKQRYQEFNDVRSCFYGKAFNQNGYPAATGIGTQCGGLQIELDAISKASLNSLRIANPYQKDAFKYSSNVLVGDINLTTPKFERARFISQESGGWIYISGTSAIRGENTLEGYVQNQVKLTVDNIKILLDNSTLKEYGIKGKCLLKSLRVYIKNAEDWRIAKGYLDSIFPDLDILYVKADICRDNLLIEMEGEALVFAEYGK